MQKIKEKNVMDERLLRKAQLKMVKALEEFDKICVSNDIEYWIDAGSLLGAVRHKGFIPWDDDIDICMTRDAYNKFIALESSYKSDDYYIHIGDKDPYYANINIPCKFRINGTSIIEKSEIKYSYYDERSHHGLFIDIFPYDKYSKNRFVRAYFERLVSYLYICKVFSKYKNIEFIKRIARFVGYMIPIRVIHFLKEMQLKIMANRKHFVYGAGIETPFKRAYFSENEIFPVKRIVFEDIEVNCPADHIAYLVKMFGADFMSLPDAKHRVSHYHKIDLEEEENKAG